jgi:hypothetical protein
MNYKERKIKELEALQKNKVFDESIRKLNDIKEKIRLEWGKDRILTLISPELLLRFKRAENKYSMDYHSTFNKVKLNEMMIRAYEALILDAINRGYSTLSPEFIYAKHPDTNDNIIICVNEDDVPIAFEKYKSKEDVIIFHINEILISMTKDFIDIKKKTHKLGGRIKSYVNVS